MIVSAVWLAATIELGPTVAPETAPPPRYPLVLPAVPDLAAPGDPFALTDLRYHFRDSVTASHDFAARIKVLDRAYVGAEFAGEVGTLTLETQRLQLQAAEQNGIYDLTASYRHRRFIAGVVAERLPPLDEKKGWRLTPSLVLRISPGLELSAETGLDTRRSSGRWRRATAGLLWQHGAAFEGSIDVLRLRETTIAGFENTIDSGRLSFVGQLGPTELSGDVRYDDVQGRFPHEELDTVLGARLQLSSRLLAEAAARGRFEDDLQAHEYHAGVTWFARRFRLPRSGPAAARESALARQAIARGYNERRVFSDDALRAQRERLALSRDRDALAADLAALYRAQVDSRVVPLLGFEYLHREDHLAGIDGHTLHALVGVPWPLAWPWRAPEDSVPFLRLDLVREHKNTGLDFVSVDHRVGLTVSLNREMDIVLRWSRTGATPLDLIREIGPRKTIDVSYVYAFGR
jgi:hypothetical protein